MAQGKPDSYHVVDKRHNKSSRIGDTGEEFVAARINNKLSDGKEVHYDDIKQAVLDVASLTHQIRSHGPARTSIDNSVVQRILNKYDFTVGKPRPPNNMLVMRIVLRNFNH